MSKSTILLAMAFLGAPFVWADATGVANENSRKTLELQHTEVWSQGNVALIPSVYTEGFIGHFPGGMTVNGHRGIRETVESHRISFPDWNEEVLEVIIEGDRGATHYVSRGTHKGEFLGIPATGKEIVITEASIYRLVDGLIAEQWAFPDIASLRQQLLAPEKQ